MARVRSDALARPLAGRHAVVTGGGRGIGAAVAEALARLGATLTLVGRDAGIVTRQAESLAAQYGGQVAAMRCDVADAGEVEATFQQARARFGDAYALVNNAGQAASASVDDTTRELWDRMLAVNLTGAFLCARAVLPAMVAAGVGRVVNVASTAALKGYPRTAAYAAAKAGVLGLTRALAAETAKHGVTVNAVCPGYADTAMAQAAIDNLVSAGRTPAEARRTLERLNPRGSLITTSEVASTVAWLCTAEASAITGQAIVVAAGEVM